MVQTHTSCFKRFKRTFKWQKIPCVSPIYHKSKSITNFEEKETEIFNSFLSNKCKVLDNAIHLSLKSSTRSDQLLPDRGFKSRKKIKIIQNLDLNKAPGHDMIIVGMLKLRGSFACKPNKLNLLLSLALKIKLILQKGKHHDFGV